MREYFNCFLIASFRFERGGLASVGIRTYPTVLDRAKDFSLSLVNEWLECFLAALETYCWIFGERLLPSADLLGGGLLIHGSSPPPPPPNFRGGGPKNFRRKKLGGGGPKQKVKF